MELFGYITHYVNAEENRDLYAVTCIYADIAGNPQVYSCGVNKDGDDYTYYEL